MTAKKIKDLKGFTGKAALYECDPPLEGNRFVVVSATVALYTGAETYIFAADAEGNVTNWGELPGSFRGALHLPTALEKAGYSVE